MWDTELERSAQEWAETCLWEHGPAGLLPQIGQNLGVHWGRSECPLVFYSNVSLLVIELQLEFSFINTLLFKSLGVIVILFFIYFILFKFFCKRSLKILINKKKKKLTGPRPELWCTVCLTCI